MTRSKADVEIGFGTTYTYSYGCSHVVHQVRFNEVRMWTIGDIMTIHAIRSMATRPDAVQIRAININGISAYYNTALSMFDVRIINGAGDGNWWGKQSEHDDDTEQWNERVYRIKWPSTLRDVVTEPADIVIEFMGMDDGTNSVRFAIEYTLKNHRGNR